MKVFRAALSLVGLLAALPATAAHKDIVLSDSLVANSDKLKVKQGAQWLGIHKWRFGDYAVVSSKAGWGTYDTKTNFWKTKTESSSANKFSFVLRSEAADSAFVNAVHEVRTESHHGLNVGHGVSFGSNESKESEQFTAFITIGADTADTWTLSMGWTSATDSVGSYQTLLTNGERNISLNYSTSRKIGDEARSRSFLSRLKSQIVPPAMGYEFVENGQSLGAVQYFSEGPAGSNTFFVWLRKNADARLRLILAAAMTAVLQQETAAESAPASPDGQ